MQKIPTRSWYFNYQFILISLSTIIVTAAGSRNSHLRKAQTDRPSAETKTLNIWWEKGFNLEEDEALRTLVSNWSQAKGYKTKLSFYTTSELSEKAQRALQGGKLPDVLMSHKSDLTLYSRLAWSGQLAEVSDVVKPVQSLYDRNAIKSAIYYNKVANKNSFYGVPIYQSTLHIFYWQKLLSSIGLTPQDIPQDWEEFWQFWRTF